MRFLKGKEKTFIIGNKKRKKKLAMCGVFLMTDKKNVSCQHFFLVIFPFTILSVLINQLAQH